MKKTVALITALVMLLSLTGCFGMGGNNASSTADEAKAADVSTYDKDFKGLVKYISDRNANSVSSDIYYSILGADNGIRIVLNGNAYVEVYDFSKADNDTAKAVIADVKDDGKFTPVADGATMNGEFTKSGKYLLAWDESRSYDYAKNVATDELKANW